MSPENLCIDGRAHRWVRQEDAHPHGCGVYNENHAGEIIVILPITDKGGPGKVCAGCLRRWAPDGVGDLFEPLVFARNKLAEYSSPKKD